MVTSFYGNIQEAELKNKVAADWFATYDSTPVIGNIDFAVAVPTHGPQLFETEYLLWAEAKKGTSYDIMESFIQLILTIGKARTYEDKLPPAFLGAFDAEKIAFVPYHEVMDVFTQNDFNWNVTPSDHQSKEFQQLLGLLSGLKKQLVLFRYATDEKELRQFIKRNFRMGQDGVKQIQVTINNFTHIYRKWCAEVKPTINGDWDKLKEAGIIDADFYLADLLSANNTTLKEKLFVLLKSDHYVLDRRVNDTGLENYTQAVFLDNQNAHTQFWNRYKRPPRRKYWDKMVERRDLLVPQDVRERKGSFFTPPQWVELSQEYLARELGENWQEEYYIWDCCAGTGNLLAGLTNKYNIYASTLDKADVEVMHTRIATMNKALHGEHGGSNLLDSHVFQFDFLNDPFNLDKPEESKLPESLIEILKDEEKRKKLVIYINPPYAEAGNRKVIAAGGGMQKTNVAVKHLTYKKYLDKIGIAGRELFAQFIIRIYDEIPTAVLAQFSKLKIAQAPNFRDFRKTFRAKLGRNFIVPADTFDNVKGKFPIGFFIWHLDDYDVFTEAITDVYNRKGEFIGKKTLAPFDGMPSINDWIIETRNKPNEMKIGFMSCRSHDFSNVNYNFIMNDKAQMKSPRGSWVTDYNVKECTIYIAVCHSIEATWLNDRDQFLYPNDGWKTDLEFQSDCLAYTLFNNNIQAVQGTNHWIPFTEQEVDAKEAFKSHFMSDYIRGKGKTGQKKTQPVQQSLFGDTPIMGGQNGTSSSCQASTATAIAPQQPNTPIAFSPEAQAVMEAGKALWRYYHEQPEAIADAALYDIRLHFQGVNDKGKMNTGSQDEHYNQLMAELRQRLKVLAQKIEPKVYEYGFLKK